MASNRQDDDARAKYAKVVPPPAAPVYSRWRTAAGGSVTRELMPSFIVRDRKMPDGYALKDSPEDIENDRVARKAAAQFVTEAKTPVRSGPPPVRRLRPGR